LLPLLKLKKMGFKAIKYEFVEIQVVSGATAQRYSFPDLPKLRYTALQAITAYTTNTLTSCPSGNAIASLAVLKTAYLVLYSNERQDLYRIPYLELNRIQNSSNDSFVRSLWEASNQKITWDKSYVELSATPTFSSAASFAFGVYYA
jgi:hypothetical protein